MGELDRGAVVILQNVLDLAYNQLKRVVLQTMYGGEGGAEFPWQQQSPSEPADELAAGLGFPGGCLWFDNPRRTIRFTAAPYIAGGGDPLTWYGTRHVVASFSAESTLVVEHNLHVIWPVVQVVREFAGVTTEWHVYDLFGAGGDIQHIDNDTISVDFGATIDGQVIVIG